MKIIVDAFGGDNAPLEMIKGARQAADEYGVQICSAATVSRSKAARSRTAST